MAKRRIITHHRQRKKLVYIGVEGTTNKTEKFYFNGFNRNNETYRIKVFSLGKTDPIGMVNDMKNKLNSDSEFDLDSGDSAFIVFDVDNNSVKNQQIREAKLLAESNNMRLIRSNPCIEFWFLLHFVYTNAGLDNYDAVKRQLVTRNRLPNYAKNLSDIHDCLKDKVDVAMTNAERLRCFHLENGCNQNDLGFSSVNPYTEIDLLVKMLLGGRRA